MATRNSLSEKREVSGPTKLSKPLSITNLDAYPNQNPSIDSVEEAFSLCPRADLIYPPSGIGVRY